MAGVHFDFAGARVLVTGGSNGIGLAVARAFVSAGAEVVEVMELNEVTAAMMTVIRHSALDWDGTDPVRVLG